MGCGNGTSHESLSWNVRWIECWMVALGYWIVYNGGAPPPPPPTPRFSWGLRPHTPFFVGAPPPHPVLGGCAPKPRFHHVKVSNITFLSKLTSAIFAYVRMFWGFQYQFSLQKKTKNFDLYATKSFVRTGRYLLAPEPGVQTPIASPEFKNNRKKIDFCRKYSPGISHPWRHVYVSQTSKIGETENNQCACTTWP